MEAIIKAIEKAAAQGLLGEIKGNEAAVEKELAPFVAGGENDLVALAEHISPILGAVAEAAVAALGPDVPKLEGNAVAAIEALLEAFIAKA